MVLEIKKNVFIDTDNIIFWQKKKENSSKYIFLLSNGDSGENYIVEVSSYVFEMI